MSLTDPHDCLAYHQSRVFTTQRDMGYVPCSAVAAKLKAFEKSPHGQTVPEADALWFYGMNHGMSLIGTRFAAYEPLPDWEHGFVRAYHEILAAKAVRAFYYLLLICTREARHNKSLGKLKAEKGTFGGPIVDFFTSINGGESSIHQAFVNKPPQGTIGQYCECLVWQFYKCSWSPSYGGPAWGAVADCLARFVRGEFTAEMMMDTVWTLSHNNGPIFNKGMFYTHYTISDLIRILDVQRSGQVPQGVLHDPAISKYADVALRAWMHQLKERYPEDIGNYVDWEVVEALGSVHKYKADKEAQWKKHGLSPAAKAAQEAAEKKKQAKLEAEKKAAIEHAKNWFTVMPGVEVKIVHRKAA